MTRRSTNARSTKARSTRRQFGCKCLATAMSTSAMSTIMQLQTTRNVLAQTGGGGDYRALVCLFLDGGNDSYNMLVPHDQSEYDDYLAARGSQANSGLALERDSLLPIADPNGRNFGIHPSMPEMQTLYNAGKLAFVANVGSLIEPTDKSGYDSESNLPLGLFSHSDLVRHWQTSIPQSRNVATGWGGRLADILTEPSDYNDTISMNIALGRVNKFQAAQYANPYILNSEGAVEREGYFGSWEPDRIFFRTHEQMLQRDYTNLVKQTYMSQTFQAINAARDYNAAASGVVLETEFPETHFARDMERVARTIAAREALEHNQQIFFVSLGGWDHHAGLIRPHADLLGQVSAGLKAFYDATVELEIADKVVTFTASDFARTLAGNGQGSDHGWGGNQLVMGDAVQGGQLFGTYPASLAPGNTLDVGRGRLIPTLSVDEYAAELAMWMGIGNNAELETILPNIRNFYPSGTTAAPLGMLA